MINRFVDYGIKHFREQLCLPPPQHCLGGSYSSPRNCSLRETLSRWQLQGYFPHLPGVSACTLLLSAVICKQVPPILFQDCYFPVFLSKERENILSLFKCNCLSIRSGSNLKGETKIPVCICNFLLHYVHSGLPFKINKFLKAKN